MFEKEKETEALGDQFPYVEGQIEPSGIFTEEEDREDDQVLFKERSYESSARKCFCNEDPWRR